MLIILLYRPVITVLSRGSYHKLPAAPLFLVILPELLHFMSAIAYGFSGTASSLFVYGNALVAYGYLAKEKLKHGQYYYGASEVFPLSGLGRPRGIR